MRPLGHSKTIPVPFEVRQITHRDCMNALFLQIVKLTVTTLMVSVIGLVADFSHPARVTSNGICSRCLLCEDCHSIDEGPDSIPKAFSDLHSG